MDQTKRLETIRPDQLVTATGGGAFTTADLWKMDARDGMLPWQFPRPIAPVPPTTK